ncbi:MAG TPA: hypothetical protein VGT44_01760 [Ktedonobacteraceae bacterium]|nr:hypothetical protein [Ktedonobacteraceae bacterium]
MQEPQESQQWQTGLEYGEYRANAGQFDSAQQQKIYPQEERGLMGTAAAIVTIVLSSIGFGAAIVGIVGASIVLYYSGGQHYMLVGGIMGLVSSILLLILMIALFVVNVVTLARWQMRSRPRA